VEPQDLSNAKAETRSRHSRELGTSSSYPAFGPDNRLDKTPRSKSLILD